MWMPKVTRKSEDTIKVRVSNRVSYEMILSDDAIEYFTDGCSCEMNVIPNFNIIKPHNVRKCSVHSP